MQTPVQSLQTSDGLALPVRRWHADKPGGHVLIVHGLGEHAGRYEWLARQLAGAGWNVSCYDQRGHGASPGRRGDVPHADSLLQDLAQAIDLTRGAGPEPLVLLGHSMGGAIAARMVAEGMADEAAPWHRRVDALVLSSPALDPGMNVAQKLLLMVASALAPHLQVGNGLKPQWVSRDNAVVEAYQSDPLVHNRVTAMLVSFLVQAGRTVRQSAGGWRTPTLLMWAGADRCVAPSGSAEFSAGAPAAVVTSKEFAGLYHEIFNEPEREQVCATLLQWLSSAAMRRGS